MRRGHTLLELIISSTLFAIIMAGTMIAISASGSNLKKDIDGAQLLTEMRYATETIKLYCSTASKIREESRLPAYGGTKTEFYFRRERDISKVTPGNIDDDVWYHCHKDQEGNIVLSNLFTGKQEVLVNSIFSPKLLFSRSPGFEPNFLTLTVSGTAGVSGRKVQFSKMTGVRLWYARVVE